MFCSQCGRHLEDGSLYCSRCGTRTDGKQDREEVAPKDLKEPVRQNSSQHSQEWLIVLLLCVFLGMLGVHNFYTKQNTRGAVILCGTILGCVIGVTFVVSAVACIFDFVRILKGTYKYGDGRLLV